MCPPTPPPSDNPPGLDALPGIDSAAALAGMLGNQTLYRRLLAMFRDRERDFVVRFRAARASGDAATATRLAHDLKSVAGTLGAQGVNRAAAALEAACTTHGGEAEIDRLVDTVAERLDPVIAGLQSLDPIGDPPSVA